MGGLGNQLFQAAHTVAQSKRFNLKAVFRSNSSTPHQGSQPWKYQQNIFKNLIFNNDIFPEVRIYEKSWAFNLLNPPTQISAEFHGYFQSSKNFYGYDDLIRFLFGPSDPFRKSILKKYPELVEKNSVSIHVRRGDYLNFPNIHPTICKSYIEECLNRINHFSNMFVFSDDISWVKQHLNFPSTYFITEEDFIELWMISMCQNNILANSSFSWWGGFLNSNPDKRVFVPSLWFGPNGPNNFSDIFEKYHTIINVTLIDNVLKYAA